MLSKPAQVAQSAVGDVSIPLESRKVLFVTPEISDFVKAGGLGDVSAALPRALREAHDARVLLPGYRSVLSQCGPLVVAGQVPALGAMPEAAIARAQGRNGLPIYLLICPSLYDRPGPPYGATSGVEWEDNDLRFGLLGWAAAVIARNAIDGWRPDLLHLNDWPSGLASAYLATDRNPTPTIMTIHNLAYQGLFDHSSLHRLGLPEAFFQPEGLEFYGRLSFLKAGLFYSSYLTTVSATYAEEIMRPEFGCGMDGLLRKRAQERRLAGILNGIDESWNPASDAHLIAPFNSDNCDGRAANREQVRASFGLSRSNGPLFAIISRLVHQKGVDIAIEAAESIVEEGGQIVVTGQGEREIEDKLKELARRRPGAIGANIGYDETSSRRMYAGSDFLLMPSRFEPCGLSQMYAQRFGSLPIAHQVGGLSDTIEDGVTGFLFSAPLASGLQNGVRRAFAAFRSGGVMKRMRYAAMTRSYGWREAVKKYSGVYAKVSATRSVFVS